VAPPRLARVPNVRDGLPRPGASRYGTFVMPDPRERFATLVSAPSCHLDRAALEIARIGHPDLDPTPSLQALDALADGLRPRLSRRVAPDTAAALLARYLFEECGFRGNRAAYYDPRNSFLNDVLERRTGIPISLSVVAIEVGRRLGIALEGVGFPGHFLVRVVGPGAKRLLDCFQGGTAVDQDELLARLRTLAETSGGPDFAQVPPRFLEATPVPGILARMLRNLLRIYLEKRDWAHALAAVDLLLVLTPRSAEDLRVRARLYEELECFASAAADLRRYLALAPKANDAVEVRKALGRLTSDAPTLH
jgi:regulator of sirC expression with transglutaminase-like and TPR domain